MDRPRRNTMNVMTRVLGVALVLTAPGVWGQNTPVGAKQGPDVTSTESPVRTDRTFYLANTIQSDDAHEIYNALRNMLDSHAKIYLESSQTAILVQGTPDELVAAQRIITDLDRPKKTYRLTYTITELDGTKRVGTQHFSMIMVSGQRTTLKQGSKVPVATGSYAAGTSTQQTQFTYIDVGMNF